MGIKKLLIDGFDPEKDFNKMKDAVLAYRELCKCYRIGKRPSEKLFKRLEKADNLLKK